MLYSRSLLSSSQDLGNEYHHSLVENDLYDNREACIGSLVSRSPLTFEPLSQKDTSEVFDEFYVVFKQLKEDPLSLTEKFCLLTGEYLTGIPRPGRRTTLSIKTSYEPSLYNAIDLERSVWQLINALYSDRLCHSTSPNISPFKPNRHSEKEIVNHLYDNDDDLRETQIIVDWLEGKVRDGITEVAEKYECLFNDKTIWENTLHLLETLDMQDLKSKHLVTHLFPDAALIGEGGLAQKDVSDENLYLHYLFLCVRGGDLQRAQRLCLQRGDVTRAVAMEGWRPFHSSYLSDETAPPEGHSVEGNATRVLSKCVAWWNAENPSLNPYERAIFAAQSGNLSALLQNMTSGNWEDLLWAHCRALVESRVDATLRTNLDCGPRANTLSVFGRPQKDLDLEDLGLQLPDSAWLPGSWTLSEAFAKAETALGWSPITCLSCVAEGGSSFVTPTLRPSEMSAFLNHHIADVLQPSGDSRSQVDRQLLLQAMFYTIFRAIALREYSDMLAALASSVTFFLPTTIREILTAGVTNADWPELVTLDPLNCQVLRFLVHLVLCLQRLETELPDEHCNSILEAYISTLIVERRYPLIAAYIAQLSSPSRQTRWYASFLSGLRKAEDRQQCLEYAAAAGLNVQSVTRAVIRIVRRRFDEMDRAETSPKGTVVPSASVETIADIVGGDVVGYLTQVDKNRIAAIDWLVHDRAQRGEVLVLANSLLRLFIAMRKLQAARAVLDRLPLAILDQLKLKIIQAEEDYGVDTARAVIPPWLANTVREHECLILYLQVRESFDQWYFQIKSTKPTPPATNNDGTTFSLADRVAAEEAEKNFRARLECWNHEIELRSLSLVKQLESLLTYESPGWLVDAAITQPRLTTCPEEYEAALDVTGMFASTPADEDEGDLGIAGLGDSPHARKLQMNVLREVCLREVVFMLIEVYRTTGRHVSCVRLADLVADKNFGIFKQSHPLDFTMEISVSVVRHLIHNKGPHE
uniref:Nuclear pore complex protein n=1 Tax=Mesocestoides corti TaxID=53468 RepID=A0A5K3EF01_MESCO